MKQSLVDRGSGEELMDTKVGSVHSTDKDLWPSQICLYRVTLTLHSVKSHSILIVNCIEN